MFAPTDPAVPFPAIVVHQGTLILEEGGASSETPILEIKDLAMTSLEDPPGVVTIAGTGDTELPVRCTSMASPSTTGDFTGTLDAAAIPVGPELVHASRPFILKRPHRAKNCTGTAKSKRQSPITPLIAAAHIRRDRPASERGIE